MVSDTTSTLETIAAMRRQEESTAYTTGDYFNFDDIVYDVDIDCRTKMASWCYQIVGFCNFHTESVEIAMNFLDRYLLTENGRQALGDRNLYQLASMTALYTAFKLFEPQAVQPETFAALSKGCYSAKQFEEMELHMLQALQWRVNPPTSMTFARYILELLTDVAKDEKVRDVILEAARVQTEAVVKDYRFLTLRSSVIGFCVTMNALKAQGINAKLASQIESAIMETICLQSNFAEIQDLLMDMAQLPVSQRATSVAAGSSEARKGATIPSSRKSFSSSPRSTMRIPVHRY